MPMNSDPASPESNPPDWTNLEADLARSFQPSWTKESGGALSQQASQQAARWAEAEDSPRGFPGRKQGGAARFPGGKQGRRDEGPRGRREGRGREDGRGPKRGGRPENNRGGSGGRPHEARETPRDRPSQPPLLTGWNVRFLPDAAGLHGLAKQIKSTARTYSIFDLARLVLDHPGRYFVQLTQEENAPPLIQCTVDDSLWTSADEAVRHALAAGLEKFYRREVRTEETIKGSFTCVARCGMSGVLLGPPNHHEYQSKLRRLHAEKFARVPFAAFQQRVEMVRDEATIEQWKTEQSTREVYFPVEPPAEGESPTELTGGENLLRDFRQRHGAGVTREVQGKLRLPGTVAAGASSSLVAGLVRLEWEKARRFPLAVAHECGRVLAAEGLQLFKAHENITYAGVSRPNFLNRQAFPVSDSLSQVLTWIEEHPGASRAQLREGLAAANPGGEAPASLVADLSWLLHQGHVLDFAGRGLEIARPTSKAAPAEMKHPQRSRRRKREGQAKPTTPEAVTPGPAEEHPAPTIPPAEASYPAEPAAEPAVEPMVDPEPTSAPVATLPPEQLPEELLPPAAENPAPPVAEETSPAPSDSPRDVV